MGWTFTHKPASQSVKDFFIEEFTYPGREVLDVAVVHNVAYIARKGRGGVYAVVCVLGRERDHRFNFGYKDMSEGEHPYYYECPKHILDLLTEPAYSQDAAEWRAICRKNLLRNN